MSVAFISRVMSELERYPDEDPSMDTDEKMVRKTVIDELKLMQDLLRDKESGGTRILDYSVADSDEWTLLSTNPKTHTAIANARDWLLKLKIITKSCPRNMSEAVMIGVIMELERYPVVNPSIDTDAEMILKEVINELSMMLDFLRGKESGERSSLHYLVADFDEMTQLSKNPTAQRAIAYARDWLLYIDGYMAEFGVDEERRLDDNATRYIGSEIFNHEQQRIDYEGMWTCLNLINGKSMKDVVVDMMVKWMVRDGLIAEIPPCYYYTRSILEFSSCGYPINMWVAIILWAIEQLYRFKVAKILYNGIPEEILAELEIMVCELTKAYALGEVELEELSRLNYLLPDYADIAQLSANLAINIDEDLAKNKMTHGLYWLRKVRNRRPEFVGGERVNSPLSVGDEGVVVGFEKDVQLISRAILNEESSVKVILIKGMVGSGKTTLARQVYNHMSVTGKFNGRAAWISISSDTSANEVLVELIHMFGDSPLEGMDNHSLLGKLYRLLQGMPFFIVLDNLPKQMPIHSILNALPEEGHITPSMWLLSKSHKRRKQYKKTEMPFFFSGVVDKLGSIPIAPMWRTEKRAYYMYYTHEMKALDSDKSWQLFSNTIDKFTCCDNNFSKELERKGREMLKKCWGLPLAIIDVARQKATQRLSGMEWEALFESIDLGELLKLLEPMYHNLDEELKPYFLHLSLFKENAIMREEKLEHIWVVSGAEREQRFSSSWVEDTCRSLADDSIIDLVNSSLYSKMRKYRLNPLLHMLSIEKAEKVIGIEIIRSNGNSTPSQNPRHRVIHCGREKFNHSTNQDVKHLISLIFHGGGGYVEGASSSYWESFESLELLDMEDFGVKTLSKTTGTMEHLRYLGLRNNYIQEIPHSLEHLRNLEVLDIAQNFMVEVPNIICKIRSLRHLYMSDVVCSEPLKLDIWKLISLAFVSIYDYAFENLGWMRKTGLNLLGIEDIDENANVSKLVASLKKGDINHCSCLALRGFHFRCMPCLDEIGKIYMLPTLKLNRRLARLPKTQGGLYRVSDLVLVNTCLDEDPMPLLEELPKLKRLKLRNAYTGQEMVIKNNGFPKLCVLNINELWNLRNILVGEGVMPKLEQLEIKNCPHLETLPKEIGSMKCLRKFKMLTTRHIATKIKNSGLISKILEVDIGPLSSMA